VGLCLLVSALTLQTNGLLQSVLVICGSDVLTDLNNILNHCFQGEHGAKFL